MPPAYSFHSINVLIPGYSIEDLPTDLDEEDASALLNACCVAWHPQLLSAARSLPELRQAESTELPPGGQIAVVPSCSEEWMGHDWLTHFENTESESLVLHKAVHRSDWQSQIEQKFADKDLPAEGRLLLDELVSHFYSLGLHHLLVCLMSRRMHFYVDPDSSLLETAAVAAADAVLEGNRPLAERHLATAFETLLDCREQFCPTDCFQIDVCLPADQTTAEEFQSLLNQSSPLTILASGAQLQALMGDDRTTEQRMTERIKDQSLTLVTGMHHELRPSLNPFSGTYSDMLSAQKRVLGGPLHHWGRRRFGHGAGLPGLLKHFGFQSALHVVLDDGIYPDRERSRFLWTGRDGSQLPAASRIPMAIDSASSLLRYADRFAESMQEDSTGAILLARLPSLKTPWLQDLHIGGTYNNVLGKFVTFEEYIKQAEGNDSVSFRQSEYFSPYLIQSAVLKTETPISHPSRILKARRQLERCQMFACQLRLVEPNVDLQDVATPLEDRLNQWEAKVCSLSTSAADTTDLDQLEQEIGDCLNHIQKQLAEQLGRKADTSGRLLMNPVPWEVTVVESWADQTLADNEQIDHVYRQGDQLYAQVRIPAGGFVWLTSEGKSCALSQAGSKPLAESFLLRNRFFEVSISPINGGVADVRFHNQRANRVSQNIALRYETGRQMKTEVESRTVHYATTELKSQKVVEAGPAVGIIETECQILDVETSELLATFRQRTIVNRELPTLKIEIEFDDVNDVTGNPWMSYIASRFAWDNESASVVGSQLGQAYRCQSERFESPEVIEVADSDHRLAIFTAGRPYHRRSGMRMLDSLLIVENESARSFEFTLDFDQPHPMRRAAELSLPVASFEAEQSPRAAESSWLLGLSVRNVVVARSSITPQGFRLVLQEVEGQPAKCRLHLARTPQSIQMIRADGECVAELPNPEKCTVAIPAFALVELNIVF